MTSRNDAIRKSTLVTLDEIIDGERTFKADHSIGIADEDDWQELKDIVARIEQKLLLAKAERDAA